MSRSEIILFLLLITTAIALSSCATTNYQPPGEGLSDQLNMALPPG
ncbi:hypothetical protein EVC26_076 [Rhizobium phage RHph_I72]|nr:hypothetical protein EVC13_074 [Rhizobium phage RHph_I65]QIG76522.1 hypothetical protein EVC26_076 [Rhizobium phage RHph_I72]